MSDCHERFPPIAAGVFQSDIQCHQISPPDNRQGWHGKSEMTVYGAGQLTGKRNSETFRTRVFGRFVQVDSSDSREKAVPAWGSVLPKQSYFPTWR